MSINLIASRYAKSLIDLSKETNKLEEVFSDMEGLKASLASRDLYLMLKSPIIKADKKNSILKTLFDGKVDVLTMSFIDIIVRKGRESALPEIVDNFINQYKAFKQISGVKVISAAPLEEDVVAAIRKELASSDITDKEIDLELEVDPSLVGGFVLKIGDKLYDASVMHQLNKLRKEFSDNSHIIQY